MRITSFQVEGFRSIRSLSISDLGPLNVFYGPNGAGKSNVLAALALWGEAADVLVEVKTDGDYGFEDERVRERLPKILERDHCRFGNHGNITIGASLRLENREVPRFPTAPPTSTLEYRLKFNWTWEGDPFSDGVVVDGRELSVRDFLSEFTGEQHPDISRFYAHIRTLLRSQLVYVLSPVRALKYEQGPAGSSPLNKATMPVASTEISNLLHTGQTKEALTRAATSPDPTIRSGMKHLRRLLSGEPLKRPYFDPVFDPASGTYDILEHHVAPDGQESWISLDLSGLGIQQVYITLASVLFAGSRIIGLEEPEAHLHAPTMGRDLRTLLKRAVDERHIDQLFIATHSNLFDLDSTGYYDVSLDPVHGTVVERRPLSDIDQRHLYEPGPAKHALQDLLRYLPQETPIFRRSDGTGVTAPAMLKMLQEDDTIAVEFLRDVVAAAVRAVQIRAKGRAPG